MTARSRVLAFGSAAALVVAGTAAKLLVGGFTGDLLALGLVTLGLGAALLLVFFEVGLSEDHERAREEQKRGERAARRAHPKRRLRHPHWPRRRG
jgi:hypothetical protein